MSEFWLGLILSIPVGIGTSLITPAIQRWLETFGRNRTSKQARRIEDEYKQVYFYRKNKGVFTEYLIYVAVRTTFITAIMSLIATCFGFIEIFGNKFLNYLQLKYYIKDAFYVVLYSFTQFIQLIGSIMIVNLCRPAIILWKRVRHFNEYQERIPASIRQRVESV